MDLHAPEVQFALESVRQAAHLASQVQAELVSPGMTKEDRSPVTVADFAAQALIARRLANTFPQDLLVGEEDSSALRQTEQAVLLSQVTHFVGRLENQATDTAVCDWIDLNRADQAPRFWTLDPIDGTKGFLRGDQYATALALVEDGQVLIGVLGCPVTVIHGTRPAQTNAGVLAYAVRGQGAWVEPLEGGDPRPLRVSDQRDPVQARLLRSFEAGHTNVSQLDLFAQALGIQAEPVRMDSQAKYAVLAAGQGELIVRLLSPSKPNYKEKIWDQAAGSLVLEEAGGKITDLHGRPLDFTTGRELTNNRGLLASNGWLHEAALKALEQIGV